MSENKIEMIIHPVRFRILQSLMVDSLTTQEIADHLPDVPKSSIYRHLKLLLDAEFVAVADTRMVKGIQEKRYQLAQRPYLGADDMAGLTADAHLRYFTTYFMTILRGFDEYLTSTEKEDGKIDLAADQVGYTEVIFNVTVDEMNSFQSAINQLVMEYMNNKPGEGRQQRKLAIITHPIKTKGSEQ